MRILEYKTVVFLFRLFHRATRETRFFFLHVPDCLYVCAGTYYSCWIIMCIEYNIRLRRRRECSIAVAAIAAAAAVGVAAAVVATTTAAVCMDHQHRKNF